MNLMKGFLRFPNTDVGARMYSRDQSGARIPIEIAMNIL